MESFARATLSIGGSKEIHCRELTIIVMSPEERIATPVGMKLAARRNNLAISGSARGLFPAGEAISIGKR
jgi:hypothetical protein